MPICVICVLIMLFSVIIREESQSSNMLIYVFAICLIFVYFLLSAQYESHRLPLAILISIPPGLTGTFLFALMMGQQQYLPANFIAVLVIPAL